MSQELASLAVTALDNLQQISRLQELLEVCLEELDQPTEKAYLRMELLLESYQTSMMLQIDELSTGLERIRNHAMKLVAQATQVPDISNPFQL